MRFSNDLYKTAVDAMLNRLAGARLRFFDAALAANRGTFPTGTVLATINSPAPLFNGSTWDEANKRVTANKVSAALQDLAADAQGTVLSFALDDGGLFLADGTVGLTGSGSDCIVDRTDVAAGTAVVVQTLSFTLTITE